MFLDLLLLCLMNRNEWIKYLRYSFFNRNVKKIKKNKKFNPKKIGNIR